MIERFLAYLAEATGCIADHYFQFPVAGVDDPIYRERVYTYELYHQLRSRLEMDNEFEEYVLSGEVNKRGHPVIRPCAPDFVLHIPGLMTNLAVVEVKPINADAEGVQKDRQTLDYFVSNEVGYQCGIELVYGGTEQDLARFIRAFAELPNTIHLYWHSRPGGLAVPIRIH